MRKAISFLVLSVLIGLLAIQVGCSKDEDPVTPPLTCSITMTTPRTNDSYFTDDQINIRWDRATGENVRITLLKGGNPVGEIEADHTNTGTGGFYPWLRPETFGEDSGDDYSIKVTSLKNSDCSDQTDQFEIIDVSNCFLKFPWKLDLPDQIAGQDFLITWDSAHTSGFVDLELWLDPFMQVPVKIEDIAQDLENTGSFTWLVDSYNQGTQSGYFFKITDTSAQLCTDSSPPFTIIDEDICFIKVWGVNDGTEYAQGANIALSFTLENSPGVVKLKLYAGNEAVNVPPINGVIIDSFDTQNGTAIFNWTVSDLDYGGPNYTSFNIRAFDVDDENCTGRSSTFAIGQ